MHAWSGTDCGPYCSPSCLQAVGIRGIAPHGKAGTPAPRPDGRREEGAYEREKISQRKNRKGKMDKNRPMDRDWVSQVRRNIMGKEKEKRKERIKGEDNPFISATHYLFTSKGLWPSPPPPDRLSNALNSSPQTTRSFRAKSSSRSLRNIVHHGSEVICPLNASVSSHTPKWKLNQNSPDPQLCEIIIGWVVRVCFVWVQFYVHMWRYACVCLPLVKWNARPIILQRVIKFIQCQIAGRALVLLLWPHL